MSWSASPVITHIQGGGIGLLFYSSSEMQGMSWKDYEYFGKRDRLDSDLSPLAATDNTHGPYSAPQP